MTEYSRQEYLIYELPVVSCAPADGWEQRTIDDLAEVVGGGTPDTSVPAFWHPSEIPWATPTDITKAEGIFICQTEKTLSPEGLKASSASLLPVTSTLLTSRATIGECRLNTLPMATNQGFASLVARDDIDPFFLFYLTHHLKPALSRLAAGTTYTEVSRREVRKIRCLVPKRKEEQREIAATLLAADQAIAGARAELQAARRLKMALLQQLFTRGIPGKHLRFKDVVILRRSFEIPDAWDLSRLGASTMVVQYGTNEPANDHRGGYPVIAIPQVIAPRLELLDVPYVHLGTEEAASLRLEEDDVLLIRTNGNPEYLAKSTIVTRRVASSHVVFASYLIRVRTNKERLLGPYLNYFLASSLGRRQALAMGNTSAGNHNLGARSLKRFWLPRPEPGEQRAIVDILNASEDLIDSQTTKLGAVISTKKSLLQTLLTGRIRIDAEVSK